jgi:hypothetical protein
MYTQAQACIKEENVDMDEKISQLMRNVSCCREYNSRLLKKADLSEWVVIGNKNKEREKGTDMKVRENCEGNALKIYRDVTSLLFFPNCIDNSCLQKIPRIYARLNNRISNGEGNS